MKRLYIPVIFVLTAVIVGNCSTAIVGNFFGKTPVQESGLKAHWNFDKLTQNNEKTPDTSGNGLHGRIHGQQLVEGVIGSAMKFEGLDQIIEIGNLGLSAPATVAFWFKTDDLFRDRRLFSQVEGVESQAGALRLDGVQVEIWDGKDWLVLIDRQMKIKEWMHLAVVFEPDGKTYGYLNGKRQHLVRCGFDFNGVKAAIGAQFLNKNGNIYTGCMDDFIIYSQALSADEIRSLYLLLR